MNNTYYTSAKCPKCGSQMKTSDLPEYSFLCEECDENFYGIEVKDYFADLFEINFPVDMDIYKKHETYLVKKLKELHVDFIGYDTEAGLLDVGWENIPSNTTIHNAVKIIENII